MLMHTSLVEPCLCSICTKTKCIGELFSLSKTRLLIFSFTRNNDRILPTKCKVLKKFTFCVHLFVNLHILFHQFFNVLNFFSTQPKLWGVPCSQLTILLHIRFYMYFTFILMSMDKTLLSYAEASDNIFIIKIIF